MATKPEPASPWSPTRATRVIGRRDTSTSPLLVMTDAGKAFVKTLGNPEGPAALISEWIGTRLAAWLGLPTFDIAIVDYPDELHNFDEAAAGLPAAWGFRTETREALRSFCVDRAKFLAATAEKILEAVCGWQPVLPGTESR